MNKTSKIFVAGHRGLVGSALVRRLQAGGYRNLVLRTSGELDLRDAQATSDFLAVEKPEVIFLAAAKVGGILANERYPVEFLSDNLAIQNNVIQGAYRHGVKRLLFLGSSCIYPKMAPQPLREEYLLTGPLEATNRAYALAKIAGIELIWAFNRQYGTDYLAVMPTNLYGPNDNYHPDHSHVIPGLIRRFHDAKHLQFDKVVVWGTGTPLREFLYSDDLADACVALVEKTPRLASLLGDEHVAPLLNLGSGVEVTIAELAGTVAKVVGYQGVIEFDPGKPDGTPRKLLDSSRARNMGLRADTMLADGLQASYRDFLARQTAPTGPGN